jgi:tetratricopeptide (TPR) repeat protein/biotin operon repressor
MRSSEEDDGEPGLSGPEVNGELQPGETVGAYEVLRFVARGGMASVYLARDHRDGREVAIKVLRPLGPGSDERVRFRREFRALNRLKHPNVLRVLEAGLHHDRPWYSMEHVPGRDLRAEVATWEGLPANERFIRAQGVLVQVLRALDYLHERGFVHRDLTPGNIMVRPDGVVKLMDFGVVKELGSDLTGVHEIMGTAAWIAPEQIEGRSVDARADLYSLGAVLYLMLTGRRPFSARSLQGWLERHLHETPRPPREIEPQVPPLLDEVCMRLLEKQPDGRYASAAHVLHLLGDVEPVEHAEHWPPRLVGRTELQARLRGLLNRVADGGGGGAILVQGAPGLGKSRVLDVAEGKARRRGVRVVRARAARDDRPFGLFARVLQALSPPDVPEVVRSAFAASDGATRERYPVLAAFKGVLSSCAPLTVLLDDLHDADGASLDLVEYLVRNTVELGEERIAFVLSEDIEKGGGSALARRLAPMRAVHIATLGPLVASDVEELVLSLVRDRERALPLAERLYAESDGSPAYLADMLRTLAEEGLLVREGPSWRVTLDPAEITRSSLPMPASLRQALAERLTVLGPTARTLGQTLALGRRPLALDLLGPLLDFPEETVLHAIDELVEAGIAVEHRADGGHRVELAHVRFRDVLLDGLPADILRARHEALGAALERHHRAAIPTHSDDLAYHFEQAGLAPKAYAYLIRTARTRLLASLWDEALGTLERALRMEGSARRFMLLEDADRALAELHLGRSKCLFAVGRPGSALQAATEASRLAALVREPRLESLVFAEVGEQLRSRGECDAAQPWLERALERADAAHDRTLRPVPLYQLGAVDWTRGDLVGAEQKWREALATAEAVGDERAVGFGYNGLGILALCTGQTMEARRQLERSAEIFERLGMLAPLAIVRVNLCELYHATGLLQKAATLAESTLAQAREVQHPLGTALGLTHRARALADLGRLDEAEHDAAEAAGLARDLEAFEDEIPARATWARVAIDRGAPQRALDALDALDPLLDDYDSEGIRPMVHALRALALAHLGRDAEARAALDTPSTGHAPWPLVRVRIDLTTGAARLALDERESSANALRRALSTAESNGYRFYQLLAHHHLARAVDEASVRARHERVASALARSLAASLPRTDGARFLALGWGSP